MIHRHAIGMLPKKPHTVLRDEAGKLMMEVCVTREGFHGPFSILYYRKPPTDEFAVERLNLPGFCPFTFVDEQPLHRRHVRTQDMKPGGDFLTGRRTLLANDDLQVGICKPVDPPKRFFSNGDGDELYFVKEGQGHVESNYGVLPFRKYDYVLIPKSTPYRIHLDGHRGVLLVFEGRPYLGIPSEYRNAYGQITDYAPFSHRDFRVPEALLKFDEKKHGPPPYPVVVKQADTLTVHQYQHFPHDVVGWDGAIYPVAFNILDYQPKTGLVHLPPTIHTTFAGRGFVVCSFVPRLVDYHEQSIPCPYGHASVDMDEILYYVDGNFTSRRGIESESISLHPQGVPHGPHPGTYERSIGTKRTEELAVMCDTYKPLRLTTDAAAVEDRDYHMSWVKKEAPDAWTSK
ncbi:MAG: homogentisate 1,2-dioxygenase [Phycisphaerae bacterium]|nr:MAG: homogentisate 1,2-dioxygenase [Planctomycetota bacterium]KAB2943788.1 MAG: homogentisate 1,2-dioxygenase [Phycisphaerae bacterium]MBE7458442.1 homogentisate 1,2-dioxygenase [Planctomycetia bacterium]MCK6464927.1 homogentisate 1,2-dioxygenase [Phycisphaerae bacterium]MCL4719184.1 homogentisate 1,2-dioxygenase [Phycisphaerae bacterium]